MCDEWCCTGTAGLSPPLIVTSLETKKRKKAGGKKTSCSTSSTSSRCFLSSPHTQTRAHMQTLPFPHTNPLVPTSKRTDIQMHTHSCYHTLITCILLQYVFAEQSLFLSGCLTSFRSLQTVSTNAWCNNYNHMKARASGITQKKPGIPPQTAYLLHIPLQERMNKRWSTHW